MKNFRKLLKLISFLRPKKAKNAREVSETVLRSFADINDEFNSFDEKNFSWLEVQRLYNKAEQEASASQSTRWTEVAQNRKICFYGEIIFMVHEFVEKINKGEIYFRAPYFKESDTFPYVKFLSIEAP